MSATRPVTAPDFLLSRPHGSVRTQGAKATFNNAADAVAALRRGELVVGALPFRRGEPMALTVPESVIWEESSLHPHPFYLTGEGSKVKARVVGYDPSPEEHLRRVASAVEHIRTSEVGKIVLARAVDIEFDHEVDPRLVAARLIQNNRDGYIADLSPAGPDYAGHFLVGSSPEVLVRKEGDVVTAYPLAGSAARSSDPAKDMAARDRLAGSAKDHAEHKFVVDHIRAALEPVCATLEIPEKPELTSTGEMWHLATPIRGVLAQPLTALELALLVHPTPAICGTPTDEAEAFILGAESDRRFYAGAVGWSTEDAGEYMVAIRCAEVAGNEARAWAGGGLVADSVPEEELDETTAKLQTIMKTLGL